MLEHRVPGGGVCGRGPGTGAPYLQRAAVAAAVVLDVGGRSDSTDEEWDTVTNQVEPAGRETSARSPQAAFDLHPPHSLRVVWSCSSGSLSLH